MVKIEWCWSYSEMFIFGQVIAKKWCAFPYVDNGHMFLAKTQPFRLKLLMGVQETIIYRLVMRNLSKDAYFWETGRGHHVPPNDLGPPNLTKKLAH